MRSCGVEHSLRLLRREGSRRGERTVRPLRRTFPKAIGVTPTKQREAANQREVIGLGKRRGGTLRVC